MSIKSKIFNNETKDLYTGEYTLSSTGTAKVSSSDGTTISSVSDVFILSDGNINIQTDVGDINITSEEDMNLISKDDFYVKTGFDGNSRDVKINSSSFEFSARETSTFSSATKIFDIKSEGSSVFEIDSDGEVKASYFLISGIRTDSSDLDIESDDSGATKYDININSSKDINLVASEGSTSGSQGRIVSDAHDNLFRTYLSTTFETTASGGDAIISKTRPGGYYLKCHDKLSDEVVGGLYQGYGDSRDPVYGDEYLIYAKDSSGTVQEAYRNASRLTLRALGSDFAEYFEVEESDFMEFQNEEGKAYLPEGMVVYIREGRARRSGGGIPMVISKSAIVAGNMSKGLINMISFTGQIMVLTKGIVNAGDLLIPSENFCLAKSPEEVTMKEYINSIGRAAESSDQEGLKRVNCFVGVK